MSLSLLEVVGSFSNHAKAIFARASATRLEWAILDTISIEYSLAGTTEFWQRGAGCLSQMEQSPSLRHLVAGAWRGLVCRYGVTSSFTRNACRGVKQRSWPRA